MPFPRAMDVDAAGNLFVADVVTGAVIQFDQYNNFVRSFDLKASGQGLAVSPNGNRLFVAKQDKVVIIDVGTGSQVGALYGSAVDGVEFGAVGEIDLNPSGTHVFVADLKSKLIKVYLVSGAYVAEFGGAGSGDGTFDFISSMGVTPNGQVVVVDSVPSNFKTHVFTLSADFSEHTVVTYLNSDTAVFGAELSQPRGFTFDAQGRGFFLESVTSQVRVVGPDFSSAGIYSKTGELAGQLSHVADAVYDTANNRLFVSCGSSRVEVLGVDGGSNPAFVNYAPTTPVPQSPVAGSAADSVNPTLVFANSTDQNGDALTYKVVVSRDNAAVFQTVAGADEGAVTTVPVTESLLENAAYTWTVQADDGKKLSAVSSPASFVVNALQEAPSVPVLVSPVAGESVGGMDTLTWEASNDPDPTDSVISYQLEISLDPEFAGLVANAALAQTELVLNALADYGNLVNGSVHFWRVTALDDGQLASAPSIVGKFVYQTTTLSITANMPDAVVSFSGNHAYAGRTVGVVPIVLSDFAAGSLSVVVERPGFETFVAQVIVTEGESVDLYAELVPAQIVANLRENRNSINGRSGLSVGDSAVPFLVDYNNDGMLDLLVGDATGEITLFPSMQVDGRERLSFQTGEPLGLQRLLPGAVPCVVDWNNDGRKDLLVGDAAGYVTLFLNSGLEEAPAFSGGITLKDASGVLSVGSSAAPAVVDQNRDGAKDLLVGNAAGEVVVFLNIGTDADPVFDAATPLIQVSGAVVPFSVDWDADGAKELLLTNGGEIAVYRLVEGSYQAVQNFSPRRGDGYAGAFPIAMGSNGKQMLVGQTNGELAYLTGKSDVFVASFNGALLEKVAELAGLVMAEGLELGGDISTIEALIAQGDYAAASAATSVLLSKLPNGAAQQSAIELLALLQNF